MTVDPASVPNGWHDTNGNYWTTVQNSDGSYSHTIDYSGTVGTSNTIHYGGGNISIGGGGSVAGGGGGGGSYTYAGSSSPISIGTAATLNWRVSPNWSVLNTPEILDALMTKMVTLYKPGDPLVICVDNEFTAEQIREMAKVLKERGIRGVIIPGARAGTGRPIYRPVKEGQERIDILARLGEVWERRPDMNLAELLAWWDGTNMDDDDFAAATEVHFNKFYEDQGF